MRASDGNDARIDVRLPATLKEALEAQAAGIGLSGPAYLKVIASLATGKAPGLATVAHARRLIERQEASP